MINNSFWKITNNALSPVISNLTSVSINTSLITDTDSTDDLGTDTLRWRYIYADRLYLNDAYLIAPALGEIAISSPLVIGVHFEVTTNNRFYSDVGSTWELGRNDRFWDEAFIDELVLSNVGAAAAAADTIRLSAYDVSAGNTSLDIRTEGTGAVLTGQADSASSVRVKVRINATEYQLLAV